MMFDFWFTLPFWQQWFLVALFFIPINFLLVFFLEVGPLASASPLSGGLGFIAVGALDFILLLAGIVLGGSWLFLTAPCGGWWLMIGIILLFGVFYQGFQRAMMRRLGLKD